MDKALFEAARRAAAQTALLPDDVRSSALRAVADAIEDKSQELLLANAGDLARMDPQSPLYDRLRLTPERLSAIASDMRHVADLPSPLDRILDDRILPNGLHLRKVSVPYGVIGIVYEARPNVTFDVFALCLRSGNACMLKGGSDADASNRAAVALIREVLDGMGIPPETVTLLPPDHEAVGDLIGAVGYVDLVIPRGGRRLIDYVRDHARVPCIETGAGVVNTYFDRDGDLETGRRIVCNAKTRRVSVCNALDCLLVHEARLADLPALVEPLAEHRVILYADEAAFGVLQGRYPYLEHATPESYGTEYMDYKMAVRTVPSLDEALSHIARFGSGHSESIVTASEEAARRFQREVDAACVYVNAPTSFTDGAQFGLGAEIGISTQKMGARGPMGLAELTTYKWLIEGNGQIRP